jgi:hypothetical protein
MPPPDLSGFLDRLKISIELGCVNYSRKAIEELDQQEITPEEADAMLDRLSCDDWYRDEASADRTGGIIRVFHVSETEHEFWIRIREEEEDFFIVISFHPWGAS